MWVVTALGIASAFLVTRYIDDVVWGAIRMKEGFKVAHELLVLYNAEIDRDSTRSTRGRGAPRVNFGRALILRAMELGHTG